MQQIIVIIIVITAFLIAIWRMYKLLTRKPTDNNRCIGCDIDCALRDLNPKDCDKKE